MFSTRKTNENTLTRRTQTTLRLQKKEKINRPPKTHAFSERKKKMIAKSRLHAGEPKTYFQTPDTWIGFDSKGRDCFLEDILSPVQCSRCCGGDYCPDILCRKYVCEYCVS